MPAITGMTPFELFGLEHRLAAGVTVGLAFVLPLTVRRLATRELQATLANVLASCLLGYLLIAPFIRVGVYGLPLREHLPLHLCGASVVLGTVMLWRRSFRVFEVVYFWGIGGVLAALLTPDLELGFPHPLFLLFFASHGLGLTAVMYATFVFGFRPRARSVAVAITATAAYAAVIYPVNLLLDANYLYLLRKPAQPSPLDYMGPWPWYILGLGALVVTVCLLCYAPFAVAQRLRRAGAERGTL